MKSNCVICRIATDGSSRNGARACKACKSFFLTYYPKADKLKCSGGSNKCLQTGPIVCGNGNIWRLMCRKCRFDKCIEMGMTSRKYVYYQYIQDMGSPNGSVDYFGGMEGMSDENMTQFDLFLNIGWNSLAGKRERFEQSQVGTLMLSHCFDAAPKAIRLYECLPMFKNMDDQSRYLIVAKSIMKVTMFAMAINLKHDQSPIACTQENFSIIITEFPTLMVSHSLF